MAYIRILVREIGGCGRGVAAHVVDDFQDRRGTHEQVFAVPWQKDHGSEEEGIAYLLVENALSPRC